MPTSNHNLTPIDNALPESRYLSPYLSSNELVTSEETMTPLPDIRNHPYDTQNLQANLVRPKLTREIGGFVRYLSEGSQRYANGAIDVRSIPSKLKAASGALKPDAMSWDKLRGTWELEYDPQNKKPIIARAIGLIPLTHFPGVLADQALSIEIDPQRYEKLQSGIIAAVASRGLLAVVGDIFVDRSYEDMHHHVRTYNDEQGRQYNPSSQLTLLYASERSHGYTDSELSTGSMSILEGQVANVRQDGTRQMLTIDTGKAKKTVEAGRLKFRQQQVDDLTQTIPETDRQPKAGDWLQLRTFVQTDGELTVGTSSDPYLVSANKDIRTAYYLSHVE